MTESENSLNDSIEKIEDEDTYDVSSPESDFLWNGNIITSYTGADATVVIPARATEIASITAEIIDFSK